jgi:hypothetical protein
VGIEEFDIRVEDHKRLLSDGNSNRRIAPMKTLAVIATVLFGALTILRFRIKPPKRARLRA